MTSTSSAVFKSQQVFRLLLEALSRPGRIVQLPPVAPAALAGTEWLLAAGETLLDHEVSFSVTRDGPTPEERAAFTREVQRRTGARPVEISGADFVFVLGAPGKELRELKTGDLAFPDGGATLLWRVQGFEDGVLATLSGPGVDSSIQVTISGPEPADLALLGDVNRAYPCGLDTFFVDGSGRVMGLPRSTHLALDGATE